jgi:inner membrane protein
MNNSFRLSLRLWFLSNLILGILTLAVGLTFKPYDVVEKVVLITVVGTLLSSPIILLLGLLGRFIKGLECADRDKYKRYAVATGLLALIAGFVYAVASILIGITPEGPMYLLLLLAVAICSVCLAWQFTQTHIIHFFQSTIQSDNTHVMETVPSSPSILTKALITGGLILLMLIPTVFIVNLVNERKQRQKEITQEVSQKWAGAQTIAGPFLFVPYTYTAMNEEKKEVILQSHFWILPDEMQVDGNLMHEIRKRSIYNVLLYRSNLKAQGHFTMQIPKDINPSQIKWNEIKVCVSLSDFKGIESRVVVKTNNRDVELSPGLPEDDLMEKGLSAVAGLMEADLNQAIPFNTALNIRGSEQLHFVPLGGNSTYTVQSTWPAPSFDGNSLPTTRSVKDSGFNASWQFNKANLPFGTLLRSPKLNASELAFGVTMVQPADQYAKSERAVKYAILIIGLTFSLFFIIEIMQKKPVHPVQYILVGIALVIFYTLLLSFSEFILFDWAYAAAALATITLISFYVKSHFGNWRTAGIFTLVLTLLYTFIFVLVRLEDTALLVGSIGLFFILAIAMYLSRKIDWYGTKQQPLLAS